MTSTSYEEKTEAPETEAPKDQMMFLATTEKLSAASSLYAGYAERPYNPDEISKKKGNLKIYDEMRRDDQVKAVLWMKKFMVLSSGWDIEVKKEEQEEIGEDLKQILSEMEEPDFGDALTNILTHLDYGFSITEPVFAIENGLATLKKLKTRAPHTFVLHADTFGNLVEIEQYTDGPQIFVSPKKLIIMIHQYEFGVPYGISDLQAAYRSWFCKDIIIKFHNIYLERFGNQLVIGTVPSGTDDADRTRLLNAIKNMQARSGLVVPEGTTLEALEHISSGGEFREAIDMHDLRIARSMLIPDLIGMSGEQISGGSFALGQKQFEAFFLTVEKLRTDIERAINRRIIQPLCLWNYGLAPKEAPCWKLHPISDDKKEEMLKLWTEAIKGNIWKATDEEINHFRKQVKFPIGEIERPEPIAPPGADPKDPAKKKPPAKDKKKAEYQKFAKRALTVYEKRVNFEKIGKEYDDIEAESLKSLIPIYRKVKTGLLDIVQGKRIMEGRKYEEITALKLKYLTELKMGWRGVLRRTFDSGYDSASAEIQPAKKMEAVNFPAEFEEALNQRAFFITGIEQDKILKQARMILMNGIEKGSTTKEMMHQLNQLFERDYEIGSNQIQAVVRTNISKTFNMGRRRFFEDPDLDGFVKAYQYSAIIDSRTSDICESLDEHVYAAGDPYIDKITPPLHFNCRSLLVPIIEGEEYEVSKQVVKDDDLESFKGTIN